MRYLFAAMVLAAGLGLLPMHAFAQTGSSFDADDDNARVLRQLLNDTDRILVLDALIDPRSRTGDIRIGGYGVYPVTPERITEMLVEGLVEGNDPQVLLRNLLLIDTALRAILREELGIAPHAGADEAEGNAPAAEDDTAATRLPAGSWSGSLDDAALAQEVARFNGAARRQLETYSATPVTVVLDADAGTIEIMGSPSTTVQTRIDSGDGRDFVRIHTTTLYSTEGPRRLSHNTFDLRVSVTRTATTATGQAVGPQGTTTMDRQATITVPDGSGVRYLRLYNGQPSVQDVPWRLIEKRD